MAGVTSPLARGHIRSFVRSLPTRSHGLSTGGAAVTPRAARSVGIPGALGRHPVPLPAESRCALRNLPARPGAVRDGRLRSVLRASPLRALPNPAPGGPLQCARVRAPGSRLGLENGDKDKTMATIRA